MKRILHINLMLLFVVLATTFSTSFATEFHHYTPANITTDLRATFEKIWVDYNVQENGVKGMRIHVKFTVFDMKNLDAYLAIYFKDEKNKWLKDKNNSFHSNSGDVAIYKSLKPYYAETLYDDLQLFMPYNEFDLAPGEYNLTMVVDLIYKSGILIQHLTAHNFDFTQPEVLKSTNTAIKNSSSIDAEYKNLWIDYNIEENNLTGMRIHLKCNIYQMKNTTGYIAIYFTKKNGQRLLTNNSSFSSKEGQVAIYKEITPGFSETAYDNLTFFMPYREFNLPAGKYDLKMEVKLIYKSGGLIKELTKYDFFYEKK